MDYCSYTSIQGVSKLLTALSLYYLDHNFCSFAKLPTGVVHPYFSEEVQKFYFTRNLVCFFLNSNTHTFTSKQNGNTFTTSWYLQLIFLRKKLTSR